MKPTAEKDVEELTKKIEAVSGQIKYMKVNEKTIRRYLRAFQSVDAAYKRILETDAWRGKYEVDKITGDSPSIKRVEKTKIAVILNERDKKMRPVIYVAVRNHSIYNRDTSDMTQYIVYFLEEACKKCIEDEIDNLCILFDMKNFSLSCMDYPMLKTLFEIMQDHYPERLGVCLILNAPFIFSTCWPIIRAWLDENTASKIHFIKQLNDLTPYVDPSVLPHDM
ncbi:CRAL-TRIO domain-containing protein C3H8.02-like [Penaeus japonicus]|uniref:CRAL-TRIO domain-containing protein C3H8.02-like n=1 Tax=Penaeus japonicus TaxID=27405 RepID=UPI001C70CFFB|nr:CRAL-TRIO domain-containing protein C3H8.02-like [Penaeus japonicus]XP_042870654.1 CRAL-TRIO domain-containing protein C3H8.02-like [Penaeus japonicus]XP_042870655.1 CRAL-TRIO domain-containing protein C3H8.02-like [Penaeus japonicus]XP_042870656.1 CRAL-TRIO domain-containing protein C3H8.02-like [Penaeus japonicus]